MEFKAEEFLCLVKSNDIEGFLSKVEHENRPINKEQIKVCME